MALDSTGPIDPDRILDRTFSTVRRGVDPTEVERYLRQIADQMRAMAARVQQLERELEDRRRPEPVIDPIDPSNLTKLVGEETARVLDAAQGAAAEIRARAEENVARMLRDAREEASRMREDSETLVARRTEEAEIAASAVRDRAEIDRARAEAEITRIIDEAKQRGRDMLAEAQQVRQRMLDDLARRRQGLREQIEQLQASRDRLAAAYDVVRDTLAVATEELQVALPDERLAAEAASLRAAEAELEATITPIATAEDLARSHPAVPEPPTPTDGRTPHLTVVPPVEESASESPTDGAEPSTERSEPSSEPAPAEKSAPAPRPTSAALPTSVRPAPGTAADSTKESAKDSAKDSAEDSMKESTEEPAKESGSGSGPSSGERSGRDSTAPAASPSPAPSTASSPGSSPTRSPRPQATPAVRPTPKPSAPAADSRSAAAAAPASAPDRRDEAPADGRQSVRVVRTGKAADVFARLREEGAAEAAGRDGAKSSGSAKSSETAKSSRSAKSSETATSSDSTESAGSTTAGRSTDGTADTAASRSGADGSAPEASAPASPTAATSVAAPDADASSEDAIVDDQEFIASRDAAVESIVTTLTRRIKRELSDEQNELLATVGTVKGNPSAIALLPTPESQFERYEDIALPALADAAAAGASLAPLKGRGPAHTSVGDLASDLAASIVGPLRDRIETAISESGGDRDDLSKHIRSTFREWKGSRVDDVVENSILAACNRGLLERLPKSSKVRWVVAEGDAPSPDCEDNSLAGSVDCGRPFPTGHTAPPLHPGCHCALLPVGS